MTTATVNKVKIKADPFQKAVAKAKAAIAKQNATPIFETILFEMNDERIRLTATNSSYMVQTVIEKGDKEDPLFNYEEEEEISVCYPANLFSEMVHKIHSDHITLMIDGAKLKIKGGGKLFEVTGVDGTEYPEPSPFAEENAFVMHADMLAALYQNTIFAASDKETRPVLTGVNHQVSGTNIIMSATDSLKLSRMTYILDEEKPEFSFNVPKGTLNQVMKLLEDGHVKISVSDSHVSYQSGNTVILARLLDGDYPNLDRIIPESSQIQFTIQVEDLLSALESFSFFDDTEPMRLVYSNDMLRVSKKTDKAYSKVDLRTIEGQGEAIVVSLNYNHLITSLKKTYKKEDYVTLYLNSDVTPLLIRLKDGDMNDLQLFSPVRTTQAAGTIDEELQNFNPNGDEEE